MGGKDPYGLLGPNAAYPDRLLANTFVPKEFNPSIGNLSSAVTAIKFHTDKTIGNNRDGSPKYIASYTPGGLRDDPVGISKIVNGVEFIEYTGEVSGYADSSGPTTAIVYGPIGAPGEPPAWTAARNGTFSATPAPVLKGISFSLKIPTKNWNGVLIDRHTGGWSKSSDINNNGLDEIHLLSQGYAHAASFASGYESWTDTNHNNDEYWDYVAATPGYSGAPTARDVTTKDRVSPGFAPMFTRDFAVVMKNLCNYAVNNNPLISPGVNEVKYCYYMCRSASGNAGLSLDAGRYATEYRGNNYIIPYSNCQYRPDGSKNGPVYDNYKKKVYPGYTPNAEMLFDGFLVLSPAHSQILADLNKFVPVSPAPMIFLSGESDLPNTHLGCLVLPYHAHRAKRAWAQQFPGKPNPWPDTTTTFFNYSFEHFPHFPQLATLYALDKNGGGKYVAITDFEDVDTNHDGHIDQGEWNAAVEVKFKTGLKPVPPNYPPFGFSDLVDSAKRISEASWNSAVYALQILPICINNKGVGRELDRNFVRLLDALEYLGPKANPITKATSYVLTYVNFSAPVSLGGICHQMINNLHAYVKSKTQFPNDSNAWVMPPASNIDPYLFNHDIYPKFPAASDPLDQKDHTDTTLDSLLEERLGAGATQRISGFSGGLYRRALDYIGNPKNHVLNFNRKIWRTPDDAARLGLYIGYAGGYFEYIDRPFTEAELLKGFGPASGNQANKPLDWNGQLLVTMTLPGRKIPQDGYGDHGGYLFAVLVAVSTLYLNRLFDLSLGVSFLVQAAQSDFPLKGSKNLGQFKKPFLPDVSKLVYFWEICRPHLED